jgi:hypothetical protein
VPPPDAVRVPDPQNVLGPAGVIAAAGRGCTVTVLLAEAVQPAALLTVTAYVPLADAVIAAVVADPPVAFHWYVPPPDAVRVPDTQNELGPAGVITAVGRGLTVIIAMAVFVQPVTIFVTVYDIVSVPADTPVTTPNRTVALEFDELHVPSAVASDNVIVLPTHTDVGPVIAFTDGNAFIVTAALP